MMDPLFDQVSVALAGRYTLVRELGQGGMGAVFLGKDLKLGREVAIKVLPPTTRAYLGIERFQREVQLVARLSHPHIVPLFEADEVDGFLYYVMEYVEGESLAQRLARQGQLPFDEALRIVAEVGDALQYAHEHGIVHRDIKPANILLSGGHARVTDFGIAKSLAESEEGKTLTGTGVTVGTAAYMSPEQASGERRIDARSDVYALAAVLYETLAGEPPFTGPNAQAIVARILVDAPRAVRTIRPNVPGHVDQALLAGLAKVPADRPPSARAFVDSLSAPMVDRAAASAGSWRRWVLVSAAVLLGGTALVVLFRRRTPPPPERPPGMVRVPAGSYTVGGGSSRPARTTPLAAFYVDSTEVTVASYQRYLTSSGLAAPWHQRPPDDWPATGVLWSEAQRFCGARGARLPTEDEWEAAARGPDGRRYPWGDHWARGRANAGGASDTLLPVGGFSLGRSVFGALDMVGNAWEWVASDTVLRTGQSRHVIKGGAFNTLPANATATFRATLPDDREQLWNTGFRCARSVQEATRD
ncbi:MAG TPA: bifunctional serine/threonine-protein kinase/formylglycine-generating enzyme family protein [Gemmatimonadales bacterium]|nr:bifunctional serine/threonine-protein kinase/formylglycine-generating enzyme family protein [Gemmatimonadales bacterium]